MAELTRKDVILALAAKPTFRRGNTYHPIARLAGIDLSGLDLSGLNLAYVDFDGSNMRGCDLRRSELKGARFYRTDLVGADFRGAFIEACCYGDEVVMAGANLTGANLEGVDLRSLEAEAARFIQANLTRVNFSDASLVGALFTGAILKDADFEAAKLWRGALDDAGFSRGAKLAEVDWWERSGEQRHAPHHPDDDASSATDNANPVFEAWESAAGHTSLLGYLICEAWHPFVPIALVEDKEVGGSLPAALAVARQIAADPGTAGSLPCTDLRDYCRPKSTKRCPDWLFSIKRWPIDKNGKVTDAEFLVLMPPCHHTFNAMREEVAERDRGYGAAVAAGLVGKGGGRNGK